MKKLLAFCLMVCCAVIYKTVSDFIHFSAKMLFNAQTTKKWSANYRLAMRTLHDQTMLCEE